MFVGLQQAPSVRDRRRHGGLSSIRLVTDVRLSMGWGSTYSKVEPGRDVKPIEVTA